METPIINKWNDVRKHLIKNGIKVAKTACCPGCSESNFEDGETFVFVRQENIKGFNARNDLDTPRWLDKTNSLNFNWGGDGTKICDVMKELPFFVEWNGNPDRTIEVTLKA